MIMFPGLSVFNGIPSSMAIMVIPSRHVTPILPFHSGASFNTVTHFPLISPVNFSSKDRYSDPCTGFGYVADFGVGS